MKQSRDAAALAASLTSAANSPLPLPEKETSSVVPLREGQEKPAATESPKSKKPVKDKIVIETVGMTLRPKRELLNDYTLAAAERTKREGRVVSAQEIMLEVLERERPKVQK